MSWTKFFRSLIFTTVLAAMWGVYVLYFHVIARYATKLFQWGAYFFLTIITMIVADLFIRRFISDIKRVWGHKVLFWSSVPLMSFIGLYGVIWRDDERWWHAFYEMLFLSSIAPYIMVCIASMMYQYTFQENVDQ